MYVLKNRYASFMPIKLVFIDQHSDISIQLFYCP